MNDENKSTTIKPKEKKQKFTKKDVRQKKRTKLMIVMLSCFAGAIFLGLIYVISPIDMIPAFIVDDIFFAIYMAMIAIAGLCIAIAKRKPKNKTSKCKICGEEANGFSLCKACFYEEKNRTNNRRYQTKTGKVVKSKSELLIDEHLCSQGYTYTYEEELILQDQNGDFVTVHPDFCIYDGEDRIYIEHWGFNEKNKRYTDIKNEKLKLYERNKITLINLYESTDGERLREALDEKLLNFEKGKINY